MKVKSENEVAQSYIYTVEYYLAIKNEIMPFAAMQIDLELFVLSEVSQKKIPYDITYM